MEEHNFFRRFIIKYINPIVSRDSALGKALRGAYCAFADIPRLIKCFKYNRALKKLLSPDYLDKQIELCRQKAMSDDASKKRFYIIRRPNHWVGLMSHVITNAYEIAYALTKGMIPVIDMQNTTNPYLEAEQVGKQNAWEFFFKQPYGYGLSDALPVNSVIGIPNLYRYATKFPVMNLYFYGLEGKEFKPEYNKHFKMWYTIYGRFMQLSGNAAGYIDKEYNALIKPGMRVLGVYYRGTDYKANQASGHNTPPELDNVIEKVQSVMPEWNCDYIFISTDERAAVNRFEKTFPGRVISTSRKYYDDDDAKFSNDTGSLKMSGAPTAGFDRENDAYLKGLEYLSSVVIFSRCTSAVMSLCSGSIAAFFMNGGKYENFYTFNLGMPE